MAKNERKAMALVASNFTLAYLEAFFTPLSSISAASTAASTRLSRLSDATSIRRYRSVHRSPPSSLATAVVTDFSSSVKAPANLKQSEI